MRNPSPLPRQLGWRSFTVQEARSAGLTPKRVRAMDLASPGRGVRTPRQAPPNLLEDCRAFTSVVPNGVLSHATAARLHGLYLPPHALKVCRGWTLPAGSGNPSPGAPAFAAMSLYLATATFSWSRGIPTTSVQRTLVDLAPLLGMDELVDMADQIVCEHHRSFGPQKFAMFPLPDFETNVEIRNDSGCGPVAPDLACKKYRTCAEYDGGHHFTPEQQQRDHDRDFATRALGWQQVPINKDDMRVGERVVITKIARMLVLAGWPDPQGLAGRSLEGLLNTRRDLR